VVEDVRHYKEASKDVTDSPISAEIGTKEIDWYCGEKGRKMLAKLHRARNYIPPSCYSFLLKTFCFDASLFIRCIESTHLSELCEIRAILERHGTRKRRSL